MLKWFLPVLTLLLFIGMVSAQSNSSTTEGGNISTANLNLTAPTEHWAGIVGWLNGTAITNLLFPASTQNVSNSTIYTNMPNGSYVSYWNYSMIVTRLPFKPNFSDMSTPVTADFDEGGMFENFTTFLGLNTSALIDGPLNTFCNPACTYTTCYIFNAPISCPYILLNNNTPMAVLKFSNGTNDEPLFVGVIDSLLGYNGSYFDFEYMVPTFEEYYFYIYAPEECNITVWIDDVQTVTFPRTGTPYKAEFLVRDEQLNPVANATVRVVENNGRNILYPILDAAKSFLGMGDMLTNSSGHAIFALEPTRYNIPNGYGYETYVEATKLPFYCRRNLSVASYSSLTPTYRTSLVNEAYGSQVKSSVQNMNSLASTASKWIIAGKMRVININVSTNGSYSPLPTLKAGAPNMLNITAYSGSDVINATVYGREANGLIIFVPLQPDKILYNNTAASFYTNETPMIIPTRYNNNANLTLILSVNGTDFATLSFAVDSVLEPPTAGEADMDGTTYTLIASALQNINMVLSNIGKSISTV
ncbi:hypothetical protein H0O02_03645 [Candidatus Micrarchaeota archaeon]|nr:hypothetical protein [Candidatus Micrarchaeota archaeon]